MEHLSIQDPAPSQNGSQLGQAAPPGAPQLPPQMFTTAAQLLDLTDKKLLLILRDGRKIFGVLRSWDQFANLVLTSTVERYFATRTTSGEPQTLFADIERGTYLVRGENVLMLGEVDLDKDDDPPAGCIQGEIQEVFALKKEEEAKRRVTDKIKGRRFNDLWGGEMENSGEVLF